MTLPISWLSQKIVVVPLSRRRLSIGAGRDHAALDMDMRIDEAGCDDASLCVVNLSGTR